MKQKDIALIIVVAFFSAVFAFILSNLLISGSGNRDQTVEVVEPIVADFPTPPDDYFNEESVNPTQLIRIGENTNPSPFSGN